ncbi:hypothetical protein VIGAN_01287600 [Vigna angularis var. angularis]|uniref:Uncharacterized protein n=1 Tax=Vigna angularis var. angularis TaxID=157739 RepID=A0A0S3R369_PHAAN|nr:hypothetical protein VIGAN_01287600 [Vigna angularis var. angularis]
MKDVTFSFCLHHLSNTLPLNLLQQLLVIPTPILQQISLSNTNQLSFRGQLPQIRILSRVQQRVVGSCRGRASETPQIIHHGNLVELLDLRTDSLHAPKIRMNQHNPLEVDTRKAVDSDA